MALCVLLSVLQRSTWTVDWTNVSVRQGSLDSVDPSNRLHTFTVSSHYDYTFPLGRQVDSNREEGSSDWTRPSSRSMLSRYILLLTVDDLLETRCVTYSLLCELTCHLHALLTILHRPTSLQYCHFRDCKALLVTSLTHVSGAIASLLTFTCTYPLHLHDMSQCVVCVRRDQVNWVQHCVGHDTLWWRYRVPPW